MRGGANVYSLPENLFSRAMCAVMADQQNHRFLIGTNSFKRENEIHSINYSEDSNRIDQEAVFQVESSEVWSISSSPYNKNIFACGQQCQLNGENSVAVYDISEAKESTKDFDKKNLKIKTQLKGTKESNHASNIHSLCWEDAEYQEGYVAKEIVSGDSGRVIVWDLKQSSQKLSYDTKTLVSEDDSLGECSVVKRDPHHKELLCVGIEKGFYQIDQRIAIRNPKTDLTVFQNKAHSDMIMDLDYNPNKLNTITTCGQDSVIRFWDLRKTEKSLLEYEEDSHWISKIKYNKFHDQLLLTGCTSTFVSLYSAPSVSQMPQSQVNELNTTLMTSMTLPDGAYGYGPDTERMLTQSQRNDTESQMDIISSRYYNNQDQLGQTFRQQNQSINRNGVRLLQRYELEDSVHVIDWSAGDAWIFAGVSYNGTFFLNLVPSKEKYKILL